MSINKHSKVIIYHSPTFKGDGEKEYSNIKKFVINNELKLEYEYIDKIFSNDYSKRMNFEKMREIKNCSLLIITSLECLSNNLYETLKIFYYLINEKYINICIPELFNTNNANGRLIMITMLTNYSISRGYSLISSDYIEIKPKRIIGYCRVSTKAQSKSGYSLEIQKQKIMQYALNNSLEVNKIFMEDTSGKNIEDRKYIQDLLNFIEEKDLIVITTLDRLSRNVIDIIELERTIRLTKKCKLIIQAQ